MGQSCGGLPTIESSFDPCIATSDILNSGILKGEALKNLSHSIPHLSPEDIKKVRVPTIYVVGGNIEIAYSNVMDNLQRISEVPVAMANLEIVHDGTSGEPHGRKLIGPVLSWLAWQL